MTLAVPAPAILDEIPVTPSLEAWRAMSPAAREAHILEVTAALEHEKLHCGEGLRHFRTKSGTMTTLGGHFERVGRSILLAAELPVLYPGEPGFAPDLLAVLDVVSPEDDPRMCWSVADEGRGLDLVLEILVSGDRNKDLVRNVARYARLGIPEYFVYDRGAQKLYGYRLSGASYRSISPRLGLLSSQILGLSLGILDGRLRFFYGDALVPESAEVLERLERLMSEREREIALRERRLEEEIALREEAERQREEAEARAAALAQELAALRARLGEG